MHLFQMAMTASMTRSKRAEGPHHNIRHPPPHQQLTANARAQNNQAAFVANLQRNKRPLDTSSRDYDPIKTKKARFATGIAVEIPSRSAFHSRIAADAKRPLPPQQAPAKTAALAAPSGMTTSRTHSSSQITKATIVNGVQQPRPSSSLTRHKEKVSNGLKHELTRLQPNLADTKDQGRKLRSQEATRFKSELSAYFPDYDEVIGNDPKEQRMCLISSPESRVAVAGSVANRSALLADLLNLDTPIVIERKAPFLTDYSSTNDQSNTCEAYPVRRYKDSLFTELCDSQRVNISAILAAQQKNKSSREDPLPDSVFEPSHKKAERLERSIRNSEKGRAQHEKDQIIRLLDGLQGHDWLRIMGVSGITESRKKTFEPAREHFIKGCQAILEKFRVWTAEEKRRKQEKERAAAEEAEAKREAEQQAEQEMADDDDDDDDDDNEREVGGESDNGGIKEVRDSEDDAGVVDQEISEKDADPPDDSDVDASIAKQLREEALAAAKKRSRRARSVKTPPLPTPPPRLEATPPKEFTSFFRKKYQRDAALSKNRRRGRNVLAWGQPVPEAAERDFELPRDLLDEDNLKAHARRQRRSKRGKQPAV